MVEVGSLVGQGTGNVVEFDTKGGRLCLSVFVSSSYVLFHDSDECSSIVN